MFAVLAGLAAGLVHVLSGPDHLAAVAPLAADADRSQWRAGLQWGLGHTAGVMVIGLLLISVRAGTADRSDLGVQRAYRRRRVAAGRRLGLCARPRTQPPQSSGGGRVVRHGSAARSRRQLAPLWCAAGAGVADPACGVCLSRWLRRRRRARHDGLLRARRCDHDQRHAPWRQRLSRRALRLLVVGLLVGGFWLIA